MSSGRAAARPSGSCSAAIAPDSGRPACPFDVGARQGPPRQRVGAGKLGHRGASASPGNQNPRGEPPAFRRWGAVLSAGRGSSWASARPGRPRGARSVLSPAARGSMQRTDGKRGQCKLHIPSRRATAGVGRAAQGHHHTAANPHCPGRNVVPTQVRGCLSTSWHRRLSGPAL